MVDTLVLEASAARRESSTLSSRTKLTPCGRVATHRQRSVPGEPYAVKAARTVRWELAGYLSLGHLGQAWLVTQP